MAQLPDIVQTVEEQLRHVGSQRSLLRSVSAGTAEKRHTYRSDSKHVLLKGDPILIVKIELDSFPYCVGLRPQIYRNRTPQADRLKDSTSSAQLRPAPVT